MSLDSGAHEAPIHFPFKARYFSLGPADAEHVWYCLHGYGQLAPYFIRKFHSLADRVRIIVPEGLHRFYLEGSSGRVGASWMTKEDRETDIQNQVTYLDAVFAATRRTEITQKVTVLGFSQGAATAGRWIDQGKVTADYLINWCGMFPEDVDISIREERWAPLRFIDVQGDQDPYRKDERYHSLAQQIGPQQAVESFLFQGGHQILSQTLGDVVDSVIG